MSKTPSWNTSAASNEAAELRRDTKDGVKV
jgi:hypothetical protein